MHLLKSLLRGLASASFKLGLVCLALLSVTVMVLGNSAPLKRALRNSKIYDNLIDNVISANTQDPQDVGSSSPLAELPVKQAAKTAFSPELIQSSTEQVIDSVYRWLEGKTAKPDFKLDFSAPKLRFATAAADNAAARSRVLPPCSLQQSRELASNDKIDAFSLPCLPAGLTADSIRNRVISDLANSKAFIKTPVITADSLPRDSQGKTVFDNVAQAPQIFHWLLIAPWILGGLTLLSGTLLVILYDERRRGLRAVSVILLGSGIFLLIGTLVLSFAFNQVNKPNSQLVRLVNSSELENSFLAILRSLNSTFSSKLLIFAATYLGLGAILLLALHFTKHETEPVNAMPQSQLDNNLPNGPVGQEPEKPAAPTHTLPEK